MDQLLLDLASKYGVLGLIAAFALRALWTALKAKFFPPADPASPIPADPTAPAKFPLLSAFLKAQFGRKAPAPANAHPDLVAGLKAEIDELHAGHVAAGYLRPDPAPLPAAPKS